MTPPRRNKLWKLKLGELSMVPAGANQFAHIVFTKERKMLGNLFSKIVKRLAWFPNAEQANAAVAAADPADVTPAALIEPLYKAATFDKASQKDALARLTGTLQTSLTAIYEEDGLTSEETAALMDESIGQFHDAVIDLGSYEPSAPDAVVTKAMMKCPACDKMIPGDAKVCPKCGEKMAAPVGKEDPLVTKEFVMEPDEATAKTAAVQKQLADVVAELAKTRAAADEAAAKSVVLEKQHAENAEKVAKLEAAASDRARLDEATGLVEGTSMKAEDVAKALKSVDADGKSVLVATLKMLREAQEQAQLFTEIGSGGGESGEEIEVIAADIRKREPTLTKPQSIAKAYAERPDLYEAARGA